ncbi:GON-4-like protein [Cephus cinctus]|uniref:GON-4-like protein n=1 Tax=Cephus cinctus TaxID=211228 RepID=A0AAJ7RAY9_CEPCN|nr:GON-4-like protein [Cephus cinctus]
MDLSNKDNMNGKHRQNKRSDQESSDEYNVSFSFNIDLDVIHNDVSSDSETAELQIDVSEVDNYEIPNKLKRDTIDEPSVINEMEEEIERQLDAKAAKTNLTATNVKNILKHVITNEHVMAMVKKKLQNTDDDIMFVPKLTRAKAKELAMSQPNIPWPITPAKKTNISEVQVLIEKELSEDSSDEEYKPDQDQQSDDERETENSIGSDLDSQPATPAAHVHLSPTPEELKTLDIQYDSDGIFKIPGVPHVPTEEESIGQRTRSKLCLSETPLEQIEQAFVPPDITTDMYDWDCEIDEDWDNFLKEFTQPLTQEPIVEDDPEADPEYNILDDEESDLLDKEELRIDKAVKVTRKELNNLVAELFEFADMFSKKEQDVPKKKKLNDCSSTSVGNIASDVSMTELLPTVPESELPKLVNTEQRHLLAIQFQQHVQFMAQHFVMTYMHPDLDAHAKTCKDNLNSIRYLGNGPNSAFNVRNLSEALKLVSDWEAKFIDHKFKEEYTTMVIEESALTQISLENSRKYVPKFHPELKKLFVESKALMHPQLLPHIPFRKEHKIRLKSLYVKPEESLIALGLEQFMPLVSSKTSKFKNKKFDLIDSIWLIIEYLLPGRQLDSLNNYIKKKRQNSQSNPIKHYFLLGAAPRTIHYIMIDCDLKAPKEQSISLLPTPWQNYLNGVEQPELYTPSRRKQLLDTYFGVIAKEKNNLIEPIDNHISIDQNLRNVVVNMLPNMPPLNTAPKPKSQTKKNTASASRSTENDQSNPNVEDPALNLNIDQHVTSTESASCTHSLQKLNLSRTAGKMMMPNELHSIKNVDASSDNSSLCSSKKLEETSDNSRSPGLRKTTPRLAKIRSAQNMKLMAQVLGSKNLSMNCGGIKAKGKGDSQKILEQPSTSAKGDNEDEIAELMLASTTIKKDTTSRKRAKQARELENIKRLCEADNDLSHEERATKFAASYLQKLHMTLEASNPETFKAVIKSYLEYNEKIENLSQLETDEMSQVGSKNSQCSNFSSDDKRTTALSLHDGKETAEGTMNTKDMLAINLYKDVCEKLQDYPEMCTDFLLFLKPHQAAMIGKSVEHTMLQKMREFINVAQTYFAKQPSRLSKVMQAITQLASDPYVTLKKAHAIMGPVLKGHSLVMDMFLQVLPSGKPPESLFAPDMFENLTCPLGPHDKTKVYSEDAPELYENIEIPISISQEERYGGENCKCECHNLDDPNLKARSEHCASCGTRFLNGRIYLQTSEGLRPAKITFPGTDEEKLENIARISLKGNERFIPVPPTRRRRKSSKNDQEESNQKQLSSKGSPTKDSEDCDKAIAKSRRGGKSPPKSADQKKFPKNIEMRSQFKDFSSTAKKRPTSPAKTKREERAEKREAKSEMNNWLNIENKDAGKQLSDYNDYSDSISKCKRRTNSVSEYNSGVTDSEAQEMVIDHEETETNISLEKMDVSSDSEGDTLIQEENIVNARPWTRQEDMILLQSVKKEYSENTFLNVSETLGDRTVQQVKERCHVLLSLLQKMS